MTIFRSLNHLYAQLVDDSTAHTISAVSTLSKDLRAGLQGTKDKKQVAKFLGQAIAKRAMEKKIQKVVFDRSGYLYHGVVKALADGAREGGLIF